MRLFLRGLRQDDIDAVCRGSANFALVIEGTLILLAYRFGRAIPWSLTPFSIHLVPEPERILPPVLDDELRALLSIILVDANTGLIRGLRALSWTPRFSRALHDAIREQASMQWSLARFDAELASLYAQYPTTEDLLSRAIARSP